MKQKQKEKEIMELVDFLASLVLNREYITKKRIENFNDFKRFVKISNWYFIRSKYNNSKLKQKDNLLTIKIKRGKFTYQKIIVEIKDLSERDINFIQSFLEFIN